MMWTRNNMLSTQTRRGLTTNLSLVVLLLLGILPPLTSAFQNCHISNPIRVSGPSTILLRMVDSQTRSDSTTPQETAPPPPPRKINKSIGGWEELHGNWVLRPPISDEPPRAVLHFLGGALVGASPQITYRYMLEKLAAKGYLIIATPYQLSFDHLETCDEVISKFELMAPTIARQYGALPVVGIGHSCGALLQLLITSLFPDTPRAANALMSFNNKPVTEAIPFFEEVFAPLFTAIAAKNSTLLPSGSEAMILSLKLAKSATEGELPSDELLTELSKFLTPPGFDQLNDDGVKMPSELRETLSQIIDPAATSLADAGALPFLHQVFLSFEQIPKLINEVAEGARDFIPPPAAVTIAARKSYRARRTLILEFADDPLDESGDIEELLKEARSVTRMRRPMVEIDVRRTVLEGNHATPLLAPPLDIAQKAEDILGAEAKERLLYQQADATVEELARWLEEGNL